MKHLLQQPYSHTGIPFLTLKFVAGPSIFNFHPRSSLDGSEKYGTTRSVSISYRKENLHTEKSASISVETTQRTEYVPVLVKQLFGSILLDSTVDSKLIRSPAFQVSLVKAARIFFTSEPYVENQQGR